MPRVRFEVVVAALLAGIGFVLTAPVAAVWVLLHDEDVQAEL